MTGDVSPVAMFELVMVKGPQNPNLQLQMRHYPLVGEVPHTRATSNTGLNCIDSKLPIQVCHYPLAGQVRLFRRGGASGCSGTFEPRATLAPECIDTKLPIQVCHYPLVGLAPHTRAACITGPKCIDPKLPRSPGWWCWVVGGGVFVMLARNIVTTIVNKLITKISQNSPPNLVTQGIYVSFWHKIGH